MPSLMASACTASGEASGPMRICAALPGRISSTRKTTIEVPISVAIRVIRRLKKKRLMDGGIMPELCPPTFEQDPRHGADDHRRVHQLRRVRARVPERGNFPGSGDLPDRPAQV